MADDEFTCEGVQRRIAAWLLGVPIGVIAVLAVLWAIAANN